MGNQRLLEWISSAQLWDLTVNKTINIVFSSPFQFLMLGLQNAKKYAIL